MTEFDVVTHARARAHINVQLRARRTDDRNGERRWRQSPEIHAGLIDDEWCMISDRYRLVRPRMRFVFRKLDMSLTKTLIRLDRLVWI